MAEPPTHHRAGRLWGALFACWMLSAVVAGCAPTATAPALTRQETLTRALARGDSAAFAAEFRAGATLRVGQLYDNLRQLRPVVFTGTDGDTTIEWTLGGRSASARVELLTDRDGRAFSLVVRGQTPLWLANPVTVLERGPVTLLASGDAEEWAEVAARAADDLVRTRWARWRQAGTGGW